MTSPDAVEYVACEDYSRDSQPWTRQPDEDDWQAVKGVALDAEHAAELFAEQIDRDGEYSIIRAGSGRIWVRSPDGDVTRWNIHAESAPHYSGSEAK